MAAQEFRLLASKCWTVGNDLLNKRINISGSIDWLKQGLLLVEKLINRGVQLDHLKELHVSVLGRVPYKDLMSTSDCHSQKLV